MLWFKNGNLSCVKTHFHQVFPVNCFTDFWHLINYLSLVVWLTSNPLNYSSVCYMSFGLSW
jgi:hypothetical protein